MPSFLDFIFPFGDQLQKQDYHFAGLRYEDSLGKPHIKHQVAGAGRFEVCLQLAYSLKSVERSRWQPGWPWVVRQTSIYNSFELEKGKSAWIIVKANTEVRDRFAEKLKEQLMPARLDRAFVLMLESHLIPCQWSNEPWRWHINFLESRLQALTGTSLTADVHSYVEQEPHRVLQQRNTGRSGISNTATSILIPSLPFRESSRECCLGPRTPASKMTHNPWSLRRPMSRRRRLTTATLSSCNIYRTFSSSRRKPTRFD